MEEKEIKKIPVFLNKKERTYRHRIQHTTKKTRNEDKE